VTDEEREIWQRRRQRALRWTGKIGRGYPVVGKPDDETEATLNVQPPEEASKKKDGAQP
jgi:hypothetical protein